MNHHGLAQNLANGHPGIERGVGILEDHLHLPPEIMQAAPVQMCHILSVDADIPGSGFVDAHNGPAQGGLAAPGFADQAKGFAGFNGEGDIVDRMDQLFGRKDALGDIIDHIKVRNLYIMAAVHALPPSRFFSAAVCATACRLSTSLHQQLLLCVSER